APGGWAFEFDNDNYPDIDDTAEVVLALRRTRLSSPPAPGDGSAAALPRSSPPAPGDGSAAALPPRGPDARRKAAMSRGLTWITGMASRDGGWAAFDADNTSRLVA